MGWRLAELATRVGRTARVNGREQEEDSVCKREIQGSVAFEIEAEF